MDPSTSLTEASSPSTTVLLLQGGGALGAYQMGAYRAMHEAGIAPDWVCGRLHRLYQRLADRRQFRPPRTFLVYRSGPRISLSAEPDEGAPIT